MRLRNKWPKYQNS